MQKYDIIGDIHGNGHMLEKTLIQLGYRIKKNYFSHKSRKAIFLGDFINRGNQIRKTVDIIRSMVENGSAYAILGNHEFNFLSYHTKDRKGHYLYTHNSKNRSRLNRTLRAFSKSKERMDFVDWLKSLPLYLEFDSFRCVHACWDPKGIKTLKNKHSSGKITRKLMKRVCKGEKRKDIALRNLIYGPNLYDFVDDISISESERFKTKWWVNPKGKKLTAIRAKGHLSISDHKIKKKLRNEMVYYNEGEKPVFFGHYCMKGKPKILSKNTCCLDFCIYLSKKVTVYRTNGECELKKSNLKQYPV